MEIKDISKALSIIENRQDGYQEILDQLKTSLDNNKSKVVAITGASGAGKSTLINALINQLIKKNVKIAIIAVDPSSPYSGGAILGDRIRMNSDLDNVFIRSVATRGCVGGISDAVADMATVFKAASYDYIIIETTGAGQNEVAVSKISDLVVLVLTSGAGDDIQLMKAGLMEIADIFVVNKSDVLGTDEFVGYLKSCYSNNVGIVNIVATSNIGIEDLVDAIEEFFSDKKD